jgi:hypothetical protein
VAKERFITLLPDRRLRRDVPRSGIAGFSSEQGLKKLLLTYSKHFISFATYKWTINLGYYITLG